MKTTSDMWIEHYDDLLKALAKCDQLRNLVTMINNDKNNYALFLACPVSVTYHNPSSEFTKRYGISNVLTFNLTHKAIWVCQEVEGQENLRVHCVSGNDVLAWSEPVKSYALELRHYSYIGAEVQRSVMLAATLKELGIKTVVITDSEVMFGA